MEPNELGLNIHILTLIAHKLRTPLSIINGYSEAVVAQAGKEKFSPFSTPSIKIFVTCTKSNEDATANTFSKMQSSIVPLNLPT